MIELDRRTVEELVALYELEPQLRDVYVEGAADRRLVEWFLQRRMGRRVDVYEVSVVEIDVNKVLQYGLEDNCRGRLVMLSLELEAGLGEGSLQATCIADSDFDLALDQVYECTMLLFTDYTSIEMYLFRESCLDKFLQVFLRGFPVPAAFVLEQLARVLQHIFRIRLANSQLGWGLEWMTFERCCAVTGHEIRLDADEFITRYLSKNNSLARRADFCHAVNSCRLDEGADCRCHLHGHDFVNLLAWYVRRHGVARKLADSEVVGRALFLCIETEDLAGERMFSQLMNRLTS